MVFFRETAYLSNEKIREWSEKAARLYGEQAGKRASSETKVRLAVEELLLKCRTCYGQETPCRMIGKKTPGQISFELNVQGEQRNPVAPEEDMQMSYDILARLGVRPRYG